MTQTTQSRQVTQSVHVITCDGPECNQEHVAKDAYANEKAPDGWYVVKWNISYHRQPEDNPGPWHFHTMACLNAWAHERRYRETQ